MGKRLAFAVVSIWPKGGKPNLWFRAGCPSETRLQPSSLDRFNTEERAGRLVGKQIQQTVGPLFYLADSLLELG